MTSTTNWHAENEASERKTGYHGSILVLRTMHPRLAEEFASCNGVSDVLTWMQRRDICQATVDMVALDEFEYDFLIELKNEGRWLAFGLT